MYGKLISTFQSDWKESHNDQQIQFSTSFGGSTTQAQNVIAGFPADVAALSLYPDIQLIEDAGLITHDPKQDPEGGIVATSAVVFDVRPGNPLNIDNWDDLAKPGVEILTPDPASSGGARWNIVAAYGAAMRGEVPGYAAERPGGRAAATHRHLQQRHGDGQERERLDQELPGGQRRRRDHLRVRGPRRRRTPGWKTRW